MYSCSKTAKCRSFLPSHPTSVALLPERPRAAFKLFLGARSGMSGALADQLFLLWTQPTSSGSIANLLSAMYESEFFSRNHEYWAWAHERGQNENAPALPRQEGALDPTVVRTTGVQADERREADLEADRRREEERQHTRVRPSLPLTSVAGLGATKIARLKANGIKSVEELAAIGITTELALRLSDRSGGTLREHRCVCVCVRACACAKAGRQPPPPCLPSIIDCVRAL